MPRGNYGSDEAQIDGVSWQIWLVREYINRIRGAMDGIIHNAVVDGDPEAHTELSHKAQTDNGLSTMVVAP